MRRNTIGRAVTKAGLKKAVKKITALLIIVVAVLDLIQRMTTGGIE